eukprot:gene10327-21552_t
MFDPSQPPLLSETLLKKRRTLDELVHRRSITVQVQNKRKRVVRGENVQIKRPEQFVREFRIREGSQNKMHRRKREVQRRTTNVGVPKSAIKNTVGLVVRIHGGRHASEEIKSELRTLKLTRKYDACFVKLDEKMIAQLKPIDTYVAYGYVTFNSVSELIHRRTYTEFGGRRKPLTDNITVEEALGDKDILCLNDLALEIFNIGSTFEDCLKILSTYRLSSPVGHFEKKVLDIHDEVEDKGGFLGNDMDVFLNKIL